MVWKTKETGEEGEEMRLEQRNRKRQTKLESGWIIVKKSFTTALWARIEKNTE